MYMCITGSGNINFCLIDLVFIVAFIHSIAGRTVRLLDDLP